MTSDYSTIRSPLLERLVQSIDHIGVCVRGIRLIDKQPRAGAGGHLVAFVHPKAMGGALVELVERTHHA